MKKFLNIALCFGLMGCATTNTQPKPFMEPQFGETKQQLLETLGRPEVIEVYQKPDKTRIEFYIYTRQYPSSQVKVPVCVINNRVVGWGKSFYEDHVSMEDTRIK